MSRKRIKRQQHWHNYRGRHDVGKNQNSLFEHSPQKPKPAGAAALNTFFPTFDFTKPAHCLLFFMLVSTCILPVASRKPKPNNTAPTSHDQGLITLSKHETPPQTTESLVHQLKSSIVFEESLSKPQQKEITAQFLSTLTTVVEANPDYTSGIACLLERRTQIHIGRSTTFNNQEQTTLREPREQNHVEISLSAFYNSATNQIYCESPPTFHPGWRDYIRRFMNVAWSAMIECSHSGPPAIKLYTNLQEQKQFQAAVAAGLIRVQKTIPDLLSCEKPSPKQRKKLASYLKAAENYRDKFFRFPLEYQYAKYLNSFLNNPQVTDKIVILEGSKIRFFSCEPPRKAAATPCYGKFEIPQGDRKNLFTFLSNFKFEADSITQSFRGDSVRMSLELGSMMMSTFPLAVRKLFFKELYHYHKKRGDFSATDRHSAQRAAGLYRISV